MLKKSSWLKCLLFSWGVLANLNATNYYISSSGNDQNSGTIYLPWHSINKVNEASLKPGDAIYFHGGETFFGSLLLKESGSNQRPIIIGSYGQSKATLDSQSQSENGIYGYNVGGYKIENLRLINSELSGTDGFGICFLTDDASGKKYPGVIIDRVDISGEHGDGINIGSWQPANPGWDFLVVQNVQSHDNGVGMSTYGYTAQGVATYAIGKIDVSHSEFFHNISSGLVLCGAAKGNVEDCSFHDNQSTGGCWTWGTSGVTIRHCISFNNLKGNDPHNNDSDGFGFDLDGGSQNCTVEYCLSYNNDTPGFVIFDYPQSATTKNNTIRFCISENDARCDKEWGSFEILPWGDTAIKNCNIYNCVAYLTSRSGITSASGFEIYGRESSSGDYSGKLADCSFRNNVIYLDGAGSDMRFFTCNPGATRSKQIILQKNLYYSTQNTTAIYFDNSLYTDFEEWAKANPDQENLNGVPTYFLTNPHFSSVGTACTIQDPELLYLLEAYIPSIESPVYNQGLDLYTLFGINSGHFDFWGNILSNNGPFSIGAFHAAAQMTETKTVTDIKI